MPPALLTSPSYYGTLAAVRSLGRASIPVKTAGPRALSIAGASKYTERHLSCPDTTDSAAFIAWLEDFGRQHEKHVLLPTCDDTAWLYALHRERLGQYFYLASPSVAAVHGLLHKGLLAEHARAVGLDVPRTWFPTSNEELERVTHDAHFPVLIKSITQSLFGPRSKGQRVDRPDQLIEAYRSFAKLPHGHALLEFDASTALPMVQEFFPNAQHHIYNISGYIRGGKLQGARAGRKVLQHPRQLGVGVCFEEAALDPELVSGLERLARRVDFNGVFEVEFVPTESRQVLIDFNPRFYGQMGFDIARGLPLPLLAYYDALATAELPTPELQVPPEQTTGKVFTNGAAFKLLVHSQRLSGSFNKADAAEWLAWYDEHEADRIDAVRDADDPWPAHVDRLEMVRHHLRHPRHFLRSIVLDR